MPNPIEMEKLNQDLKQAALKMSVDEIRFLVDSYYRIQNDRCRSDNQSKTLTKNAEPHQVLLWLADSTHNLERYIHSALDVWSRNEPRCKWSRSQHGIGPVIASGLMAHIDIHKAPTVGHIWSFAGLNPNQEWKAKTKRPWNAQLKTICWKAGQSFVKQSSSKKCYYGHVYKERKLIEVAKNENFDFREQAEAKLKKYKIGKDTEAYKAYSIGKLPAAHINARSERYAVKLFLSHWHHYMYIDTFGKEPPLPYPIAHQGHVHYIEPPKIQKIA